MIRNHFVVTLLSALFFLNGVYSQGFLKRNNKAIVDGNGNEIILRGIGLGGWMLQEPYMLNIDTAVNQTDIRYKIEALVGKENTDAFYTAWLANYMTHTDVDSLAAFGFNSIRLPMHYNLFTPPIEKEPVAGQITWIEKGFVMIDSLLAWCKANRIYLILDLHAAPGGQGKDAAISDYNESKPSIWESAENRTKFVALWKKLAERYANDEWIGGYDLINEPNWDLDNSGNKNGCNCSKGDLLLNLYKDAITAIRTVDKNHMIIVEGNCWGNRYDGITSIASFDSNIVFSFHKYWSFNTTKEIADIMDLRNTLNIPIWCGESGENSNPWFTAAIKLFETNKIGWSWWTWKRFESVTCINSVLQTANYKIVNDYWAGKATKPTVEIAKKGLMEMAENLKLEKCIINRSVIDAMFRQVQTSDTKPYTHVKLPGKVFAINYDYGQNTCAYYDTDTANYHTSTQIYTTWNAGYGYRNDGVDIQACDDVQNPLGYNVGWTNPGEWMQYTVTIDSSAAYHLSLRYASENAITIMHILQDGIDVSGELKLPSTGSRTNWSTLTFNNISLRKGTHKLRVYTHKGGVNLGFFQFSL